jgi:FkbM family methyltransferase
LDEYFKDYSGRIDFIRQDVEGAECQVLKGARNVLLKNKNLIGIIEFWPKALKRGRK